MKLYYTPGACSLASHIVLCESGLPYTLERVDLRNKTIADGRDFLAINPLGYVPVLELNNGEMLTEGTAILFYLADRVPNLGLVPPAGEVARYRLLAWLNFIGSELHKNFSPLFGKDTRLSTKPRSRLVWRPALPMSMASWPIVPIWPMAHSPLPMPICLWSVIGRPLLASIWRRIRICWRFGSELRLGLRCSARCTRRGCSKPCSLVLNDGRYGARFVLAVSLAREEDA